MHLPAVPNAVAARTGVTVRLAPEAHDRLRRIAQAEHRSVAGFLELLSSARRLRGTMPSGWCTSMKVVALQ